MLYDVSRDTSTVHCFDSNVCDTVFVNATTAHKQVLVHDNVLSNLTAHEPYFTNDQFIDLHERVKSSGQSNFRSCRLSVPSRLRIANWRIYLKDYHDDIVCDYLEFGWPLDYVKRAFPISNLRNHQGATSFSLAINQYLHLERS